MLYHSFPKSPLTLTVSQHDASSMLSVSRVVQSLVEIFVFTVTALDVVTSDAVSSFASCQAGRTGVVTGVGGNCLLLRCHKYTPITVSQIYTCHSVTNIHLSRCHKYTPITVSQIYTYHSVTNIHLSRCHKYTPVTVSQIYTYHGVTNIHLSQCHKYTPVTVSQIYTCHKYTPITV